ncbi:hypothetical protein BJX61DRAFT_531732 [Aspergillus egyptiacus]|nr:hypothetical protein BJX61DRAFT_531732 [Aspergillus egyptiacus]
MPPSTVLSYWRRRSTASPVSPASQPTSKAPRTNSPPQLPLIADPTTLTAHFDEKTTTGAEPSPQALADCFPNSHGAKTTSTVPTSDAASPSTATPAAARSASGEYTRPLSKPEERDKELSTTASQSVRTQPSRNSVTSEQTNGDCSKPPSPFLPSSCKGLLSSQAVDGPSKRSTSPGMALSSHRRFRTSSDEPSGDKASGSQREHRFERPTSRRPVDRDVHPAEHVSQKSGKTMLHLLNPMSLLAKRRSHQMTGLRAEDVSKGSKNIVPAIPDDYDPRIRGNIVHDFSAPRPRRQPSTAPVPQREQTGQSGQFSGTQHGYGGGAVNVRSNSSGSTFAAAAEPGKRHTDHSPVFREHFEEDSRALQVENKAYLQSPLLTDQSNRDHDPHALPVFARKLPSSITNHATSPDENSKSIDKINATNDGDATGVEEDSDIVEIGPMRQSSGLPKHFKSNASRFSFDMNGVGSSTQEKLLEEKHKEKEAARKAQARLDGEFSDVDDDYDSDMFDDLDGLEEEIPGVNVDAGEGDEFKNFSGPGNILNPSWLAPDLSPVITRPLQPGMPTQDDGIHLTKHEEPDISLVSTTERSCVPVNEVLGSSSDSFRGSRNSSSAPLQTIPDDDDLYFDDGEFDELSTGYTGEKFDESIFDDPTSHLYERKQPSKPTAAVHSETGESALEAGSTVDLMRVPSTASEYHQGFAPRRYGSVVGNIPNPELVKSHSGVLSEHNLEAFHNALADAANQETINGRFGYTTSVSERSLGQESGMYTADSQSGRVSDDSRLSQDMNPGNLDGVFEEFNYDDDYDPLYDDPIIAAANAEALENDDEGFYGQEFGFYAQAYGNGSELTNGGYFAPRRVDGISRSYSGRGKFREPCLTPITERSEWSTRNSIISVTAHGVAHSNQSVSSPGLAQLVDMGSVDDEMSLGALMKLRRNAWGGSNGSLRSSSGSPPPQQQSASNRASFALSDVSPSVYTVPPDFMGGSYAVDLPGKESDKTAWTYHPPPTQRTERPTSRDGESPV